MPTVDPDTAVLHKGYEPIKTLRTYRMLDQKDDVYFGMNLINKTPNGKLRVGDTVQILDWHP